MWLTPSLLALLAPLIPLLSQAVELRQLKSDDFKQSISHGQWFVLSQPPFHPARRSVNFELVASGWSSISVRHVSISLCLYTARF